MRTPFPLTLLGCLVLAGCQENSSEPDPARHYDVTLTYTEQGVPHIKAKDYASLGFGAGYAHAEENLCTLSEQIMKLRGEKSRWLGAGEQQRNLLSDVGYRSLDLPAQAAALYGRLAPDARHLIEGYVAGFNHSLSSRAGPADYPSPCRGAEWVEPITPTQLLAYHLDLAQLASGRSFIGAMASAQPPGSGARARTALPVPEQDPAALLTSEGIGSNGWALGADRSSNANSLLLGNPHFPWDGELRFYEQHLQIPGELNVTGATMMGFPAILIGFNEQLGWTHTVSQSKRFTLYQLTLDPANPLRYRYGDQWREMSQKAITVQVRQADGSLQPYSQTVYASHFGPMVNLASLSPSLGWTSSSAISFRDANAGNYKMLEQWLAMAKAQSTPAFFDALAEHQGVPWVNTLLIDKAGQASYVDATQVPRLGTKAEAWWRAASQTPQLAPIWLDGEGSVLLPGNDPDFEWVDSGQTRVSGLVPLNQAPRQTRSDYVYNANSSHWLTNLAAPLEGYSILYGPEQTVRSPRTRYNAQLISTPDTMGLTGSDRRFTLQSLQRVLTHNGSLFARELRDPLLARCQAHPLIQLTSGPLDLTPSCNALANWDGEYQLESRGAHLMREWLTAFRTSGHRDIKDALFAIPFAPAQGATTPSGLAPWSGAPDLDPALLALAQAQQRLQAAGIAPDAELGALQFVQKAAGLAPIALPGGNSFEGMFNMVQTNLPSRSSSDLANIVTGKAVAGTTLRSLDDDGDGQPELRYRANYGSSFVLALQFDAAGPKAERFLSYGQSHDPESPHFTDQTEQFARQQWQPMRFTEQEIAAHQERTLHLKVLRTTSP
ncbi:penicillin acylase family protein [Aeromonas hydrophila]|uniref:penicillin acylase family protein n=1 Tax=Aeromonas hydrophila TaxID=644 RepID=UPI000332B4B2|nr:penicillin acylase family protein [Aeromonas hydrophila]AGM43446.1 peptidase S45 penicillin amidase [Aeromonas hydrophila ML09-119]AHX32136.1 acyl-homoserine-lactone acylase [Aeromonas hydrophila subsp. hydrophila AL09-71]AHX68934.1 acyl-homoserine-lactone acylase [Aeromonas hydrophila pc104A]AJE37070.1 acyl-homoserine-lactone acylase [Aeromonas hydrophila J-1]AKJ35332.1 acyl-homoserine-lactone acylase [Aeromonas hydrophila NJ-35]